MSKLTQLGQSIDYGLKRASVAGLNKFDGSGVEASNALNDTSMGILRRASEDEVKKTVLIRTDCVDGVDSVSDTSAENSNDLNFASGAIGHADSHIKISIESDSDSPAANQTRHRNARYLLENNNQ